MTANVTCNLTRNKSKEDIWINLEMPPLYDTGMLDRLAVLCTCTSIESATAVGVTGYLLYLGMPIIALISAVVFAKIIVFHVIVDHYDKRSSGSCRTCATR